MNRYEDESCMARLAKVRERIKGNFPRLQAPLSWHRDGDRLVSDCNRFAIERFGAGEARRYNAMTLPTRTIIGHRLMTPELAKEVCERHAPPQGEMPV